MKADLTVDITEVRAVAAGLGAAGGRVSAGVAEAPETVMTPRWATGDAAALAGEAFRRQLAEVGGGITATAREMAAAAVDYAAADERSAARMRVGA